MTPRLSTILSIEEFNRLCAMKKLPGVTLYEEHHGTSVRAGIGEYDIRTKTLYHKVALPQEFERTRTDEDSKT